MIPIVVSLLPNADEVTDDGSDQIDDDDTNESHEDFSDDATDNDESLHYAKDKRSRCLCCWPSISDASAAGDSTMVIDSSSQNGDDD